MIIGIIGSRTRNSTLDKKKVEAKILELKPDKILTGDCERGGDKIAREKAIELGIELQIFAKKVELVIGEDDDAEIDYMTFTKLCYERNERLAKSEMDYLVVLPHLRKGITGGTRNTVNFFKKYHEDWRSKLIQIK